MAIKLAAFDLDGTLLAEDHAHISDRNKQALLKASRMGIKIVIASGRTWSVLQDSLVEAVVADYALIANGAAVVDVKTQKDVFRQDMPQSVFREIYHILKQYDAVFEVYCGGKTYVEHSVLNHTEFLKLPKIYVEELKRYMIPVSGTLPEFFDKKGVEKIHVMTVPKENRKDIMGALSQVENLALTSSMPGNIEINTKGTNKAVGLSALCDLLHIKPDEVMAFGDANNDLEMLKFAKWSFAMGNGTDEVKKAASYLTDTNGNDGVAKAMETYIF